MRRIYPFYPAKTASFTSVSRTEDILYKLNKNGVRLSIDEVLNERKFPSSPIHAMYIARAASKKGYGSTPFAFYVEYLAQGKCAYSDIGRPSWSVTAISPTPLFFATATTSAGDISPSE